MQHVADHSVAPVFPMREAPGGGGRGWRRLRSGGELISHQQLGSGAVRPGWATGSGRPPALSVEQGYRCWAGRALCVSGVCQTGTGKTQAERWGHDTGSGRVREPPGWWVREGREAAQGPWDQGGSLPAARPRGEQGRHRTFKGRRQAGASSPERDLFLQETPRQGTSVGHCGPGRTPKPARDPWVPLRGRQKWAPRGMSAGESWAEDLGARLRTSQGHCPPHTTPAQAKCWARVLGGDAFGCK